MPPKSDHKAKLSLDPGFIPRGSATPVGDSGVKEFSFKSIVVTCPLCQYLPSEAFLGRPNHVYLGIVMCKGVASFLRHGRPLVEWHRQSLCSVLPPSAKRSGIETTCAKEDRRYSLAVVQSRGRRFQANCIAGATISPIGCSHCNPTWKRPRTGPKTSTAFPLRWRIKPGFLSAETRLPGLRRFARV